MAKPIAVPMMADSASGVSITRSSPKSFCKPSVIRKTVAARRAVRPAFQDIKPLDLTYQPDKRVMSKIKHERTADCVIAGYRVHKSGPDAIGSLLLGLSS